MNNNYIVATPDNQDLNHTPTVTQFLNAANAEYAITGTPAEMNPFD